MSVLEVLPRTSAPMRCKKSQQTDGQTHRNTKNNENVLPNEFSALPAAGAPDKSNASEKVNTTHRCIRRDRNDELREELIHMHR